MSGGRWIGKWVQRVRPTTKRRTSRAHYIESEKLDADPPIVVSRCGKDLRLSTVDGKIEEFVAREIYSRCKTCDGRQDFRGRML